MCCLRVGVGIELGNGVGVGKEERGEKPGEYCVRVKDLLKNHACVPWVKGIYHGYTWGGHPETTKLSNLNDTNFNQIR